VVAGARGDGFVYLMTDADGEPLAGNITAWPAGVSARSGWLSFRLDANVKGKLETHPAFGMVFTIPGGYRLLVGRDIADTVAVQNRVSTAFWGAVLLVLGVGALGGILTLRNLLIRDGGRIRLWRA
jgi:hypothetical protein